MTEDVILDKITLEGVIYLQDLSQLWAPRPGFELLNNCHIDFRYCSSWIKLGFF